MSDTTPILKLPFRRIRVRAGLALSVIGLLVFILGAAPQWVGLDRSAVVGFVQITVFLAGQGLICIGGYLCLHSLWDGQPLSIGADIGLRLVSTGFVIAVAAGLADVFGFGSESMPIVPSFGFWQTIGVLVGQVMIGVGFLLMRPVK